MKSIPQIRSEILGRLFGQDEAVDAVLDRMEIYRAGMADPEKPPVVAFLAGPTGVGKTNLVQRLAESLHGSQWSMIRIDCAEFQHSHEIAKLIGSPPGYLGHRETHPLLSQDRIRGLVSEECKLSIVLFDEIEKASDSLWRLLLGILDNGRMTNGDNSVVDFTSSAIFMTSNVGQRKASEARSRFGFSGTDAPGPRNEFEVYRRAMREKFDPEFNNRVGDPVVFNRLSGDLLYEIAKSEIEEVAARSPIPVTGIEKLAEQCAADGYREEYGARHIKRSVERLVTLPLARSINASAASAGVV